ncbi:MAG TPA: phosphoglycerate kinase [Burkholderiaceae bacterium]|nr:phosphoglycerate kinase [Burkholderiaceae bacterium]
MIENPSVYRTLDDIDVSGKAAVVRVDLNVPIKKGSVTDVTRIERILPTLHELVDRGASVILLAHFGRPKGKVVPHMSLQPVSGVLQSMLGRPVRFVATDWRDGRAAAAAASARPGDVLLMENTRFHPGEEANDKAFAAELARLGDVYINDAFSAAHRAHASTEGVARQIPAVAGRAMQAELEALTDALDAPDRPVYAIVGGAKVSTKLELLRNLVHKVDALVLGGGMANAFLAAQGKPIGRSLAERDMVDTAHSIMTAAGTAGCDIILPIDAVVARALETGAAWHVVAPDAVGAEDMIVDIGPDTVAMVNERLAGARTIVWNGPLGAFEFEPFDRGTTAVARAVARLTRSGAARSVVGGGDTVAALRRAQVANDFSFVSVAGGSFSGVVGGKNLAGRYGPARTRRFLAPVDSLLLAVAPSLLQTHRSQRVRDGVRGIRRIQEYGRIAALREPTREEPVARAGDPGAWLDGPRAKQRRGAPHHRERVPQPLGARNHHQRCARAQARECEHCGGVTHRRDDGAGFDACRQFTAREAGGVVGRARYRTQALERHARSVLGLGGRKHTLQDAHCGCRKPSDGGFGRQHHRIGAVEQGVRDIGDFGARGAFVLHHRFEHLRGGDHGPRPRIGRGDDALLHQRDLREVDLDPQVAARHHHAVGRRHDGVERNKGPALLDFRHEQRRLTLGQAGAHPREILGALYERHPDPVDSLRQREIQMLPVGRSRNEHGQLRIRHVDAGARAHGPADHHLELGPYRGGMHHAQLDCAVGQVHPFTDAQSGEQFGVAHRQRAVGARFERERHARAVIEPAPVLGNGTEAELGTRQIGEDGHRLAETPCRLAYLRDAPRVLRMLAMRQVQPSHVHAGAHERLHDAWCVGRRAERADDLGPVPSRKLHHCLLVSTTTDRAATR